MKENKLIAEFMELPFQFMLPINNMVNNLFAFIFLYWTLWDEL